MSINPDGFLNERREELYISHEHQLFLLTGQTKENKTRHAFISIKPFNAVTNNTILFNMAAKAQPLDAGSRITVAVRQKSLEIYDGFTGTTSSFPLNNLNFNAKIDVKVKDSPVWDKYAL